MRYVANFSAMSLYTNATLSEKRIKISSVISSKKKKKKGEEGKNDTEKELYEAELRVSEEGEMNILLIERRRRLQLPNPIDEMINAKNQ